MREELVDLQLIEEASLLAKYDQGIFDLMRYWFEAACVMDEREYLLDELRKSIYDYKKYW